MTEWMSETLDKIGSSGEIQIAALRPNSTLRSPVTIWVVRVGDALYIRSYMGRKGAWFRSVQKRNEGRVWAGGLEKDVTFVEETDPQINDQIDQAYRNKYGHASSYVTPMLTPEVRSTTFKLVPR